jgi:hypothetical protein
VLVVGFSAATPRSPREVAARFLDPENQRRALGADTFEAVATSYDVPGQSRRLMKVELLRVGEGPVRFDLRFAMAVERLDLAEGDVLLRYDPAAWAGTEHVNLFRGVCVIEPSGSGSIVTELLIFGSDVSLPFFLRGRMRDLAADTFRTRAERLLR